MNIRSIARLLNDALPETIRHASKKISSSDLKVINYRIHDDRWKGKKPLRFALVSDFHGGDFHWKGQELAKLIRKEQVDFICVAGDHFEPGMDHREAFAFFDNIVEDFPVFYASGNHDEGVHNFEAIKETLRRLGVYVLENDAVHMSVHGQLLDIFGVRDRSVYASRKQWVETVYPRFQQCMQDDAYCLVICHQPEVKLLDELNCAIAVSGHAHGGQWRTPSGQGIFAPGQGIFPKYTRGVYKCRGYRLIVSTGFKVNYIVPRLNNHPELVFVEIIE